MKKLKVENDFGEEGVVVIEESSPSLNKTKQKFFGHQIFEENPNLKQNITVFENNYLSSDLQGQHDFYQILNQILFYQNKKIVTKDNNNNSPILISDISNEQLIRKKQENKTLLKVEGLSFWSPMRKKADFEINQSINNNEIIFEAPIKGTSEFSLPIQKIEKWLVLKNPKGKDYISVFLNDKNNTFIILTSLQMKGFENGKTTHFTHQDFLEKVQKITKLKPTMAIEKFSQIQKKDIPYIPSHIRANEGFLYFFKEGLFWGFKKPFKFYPFNENFSFEFTSITSRTFNLTCTDGTEFSMISREYQDLIQNFLLNIQKQNTSNTPQKSNNTNSNENDNKIQNVDDNEEEEDEDFENSSSSEDDFEYFDNSIDEIDENESFEKSEFSFSKSNSSFENSFEKKEKNTKNKKFGKKTVEKKKENDQRVFEIVEE